VTNIWSSWSALATPAGYLISISSPRSE